MRRFLLTSLLTLFLAGTSVAASLEQGTHARTFKSDIDSTEQPYNLYVPSAANAEEPIPLVIALHGHGASWESWFIATTVEEWAEERGYAVLCPQGRGNWFYLGDGEKDVFEAMNDVKSLLDIDDNRIYLIGHSMGGWGTWQLASSHPDVFAAIAPMAGWAPMSLLKNLEETPTLAIHGDTDPAVPVEFSRQATAQLSTLGVTHQYIELPGVGHESSMINDKLPEIGEWLDGRTRKIMPYQIDLSANTPTRGKAWWLQIRALDIPDEYPGHDVRLPLGRVQVKLTKNEENNRVYTVEASGVKEFSIDVILTEKALSSVIDREDTNNTTVKVNNQTFTNIPFSIRTLVFTTNEHGATGSWEIKTVSFQSLPPVESPVIGKTVTPRDQMLAKVGDILAGDEPNIVAVLSETSFVPEFRQGDLTLDQVIDFYARPHDDLFTVSLKASDLQQIMEDQESWKPIWWQEAQALPTPDYTDPEKVYTVLVPHPLWDKMEKATMGKAIKAQHQTPLPLRSQMFNYVLKNGKL
jgi:pimeloyl-ACP methyl ester carboxylesterase